MVVSASGNVYIEQQSERSEPIRTQVQTFPHQGHKDRKLSDAVLSGSNTNEQLTGPWQNFTSPPPLPPHCLHPLQGRAERRAGATTDRKRKRERERRRAGSVRLRLAAPSASSSVGLKETRPLMGLQASPGFHVFHGIYLRRRDFCSEPRITPQIKTLEVTKPSSNSGQNCIKHTLRALLTGQAERNCKT